MSIDLFTELMPPWAQRACLWFNYLVISLFLLYVSVMGLWLSWISRARSFQGIPEVSYSWVTMSMPVGGALLLLTTWLKAREHWRDDAGGTRPDGSRAHPVAT
jgi:TRAP-type C4-dicarboxylate transport system permease small subunit